MTGYILRHLYKLGDVRLDSVKGISNAEVQYMLQNCALKGSDQDVGGQVMSFFLVAKVGFQLVSVLLGEAREWNWVGGKGEMRM